MYLIEVWFWRWNPLLSQPNVNRFKFLERESSLGFKLCMNVDPQLLSVYSVFFSFLFFFFCMCCTLRIWTFFYKLCNALMLWKFGSERVLSVFFFPIFSSGFCRWSIAITVTIIFEEDAANVLNSDLGKKKKTVKRKTNRSTGVASLSN